MKGKKQAVFGFILCCSTLFLTYSDLSSLKYTFGVLHPMSYLGIYPNKCGSLFLNGSFLNMSHDCQLEKAKKDLGNQSLKCSKLWQPTDCNIRYYTQREATVCAGKVVSTEAKSEIIMIGDSRMESLFLTTSKLLNLTIKISSESIFAKEYRQKSFDRIGEDITNKFPIKFIFFFRRYTDEAFQYEINKIKVENVLCIITGIALHTMLHAEGNRTNGVDKYRQQLESAKKDLDKIGRSVPIFWIIQPIMDRKHKRFAGVWNKVELIEEYNQAAEKILNDTSVILWRSVSKMASLALQSQPYGYRDHLHFGQELDFFFYEMLMNFICNGRMKQKAGLCCS